MVQSRQKGEKLSKGCSEFERREGLQVIVSERKVER